MHVIGPWLISLFKYKFTASLAFDPDFGEIPLPVDESSFLIRSSTPLFLMSVENDLMADVHAALQCHF